MWLVLARTQYLRHFCDVAIFVYTFISIGFSSLLEMQRTVCFLFYFLVLQNFALEMGCLLSVLCMCGHNFPTCSFATNSNTCLTGLCARFPM